MIVSENNRLKIFTWHIHGTYLYYLSQGSYDIYIPVNPQKSEGYYGRGKTFPFGENVIEVPVDDVRHLSFDLILFQTERNFLIDQFEVLSEEQRKLPKIYVEHNTPVGHPTNTKHVLDDPSVTLVHVTHFNKLMWHSQVPHVVVIEHGIPISGVHYSGELERGIVVVNHIKERGRITGWDLFEEVSQQIPLDLVGMGTEKYGGLGEVLHPKLPAFLARYRFFFNPLRYTSFGLAVGEAMMVGMPVVALATTEYAAVFENGFSAFTNTNLEVLIENMQLLLANKATAQEIGYEGQQIARERFGISRFTQQWEEVFYKVIQSNQHTHEKAHRIYK